MAKTIDIPNEVKGAEDLSALLDLIHGKNRPTKGNGTYQDKK